MDKRIVIFVRHGQSEANVAMVFSSNVNKYSLTELGRHQAEATGKALEGLSRLDKFYVSPVLRARETAGIISKYVGMKPIVSELLIERRAGKYEETNYHKNPINFTKEQMSKGYPDIESWQAMIKRVNDFTGPLGDGVSLAVTHGDVIKAAVCIALVEDKQEVKMLEDLGIMPGTITTIDLSKKGEDALLGVGRTDIPDELKK